MRALHLRVPVEAEEVIGDITGYDIPTFYRPMKRGDKPVLFYKLKIKNIGKNYGWLYTKVYESNEKGEDVKLLWEEDWFLGPQAEMEIGRVEAEHGISKDYPAGSYFYMCIKCWGESEPEPTCKYAVGSRSIHLRIPVMGGKIKRIDLRPFVGLGGLIISLAGVISYGRS